MPYEIMICIWGENYHHESTISTLTGLEFEEAKEAVKKMKTKRWTGQVYIKCFQMLGFNTNQRFIRFDPSTDKPCILRCRNHTKGYWYLFYYNNGFIHDIHGWRFSLKDPESVSFKNGSYFLKDYGMKVTSMLEVWI